MLFGNCSCHFRKHLAQPRSPERTRLCKSMGYYKTLPAILSCILDILFQVCKNPVHATTSHCSTCGLDIQFLSLFAVHHETSLFQEPAHLTAISTSLPSVSSFVSCTLVVNKASAVTSCRGQCQRRERSTRLLSMHVSRWTEAPSCKNVEHKSTKLHTHRNSSKGQRLLEGFAGRVVWGEGYRPRLCGKADGDGRLCQQARRTTS